MCVPDASSLQSSEIQISVYPFFLSNYRNPYSYTIHTCAVNVNTGMQHYSCSLDQSPVPRPQSQASVELSNGALYPIQDSFVYIDVVISGMVEVAGMPRENHQYSAI